MEKKLQDDIDTLSIVAYPAGGKGTLAEYLTDNIEDLQKFEVGDMVREHIRNNTELAQIMKEYSAAGKMVPNEVIVPHIQQRVGQLDASKTWLLDGFPRVPGQIQPYENMMEQMDRHDAIIHLSLSEDRQLAEEIATERMIKRGEQAIAKGVKPRTEDVNPDVRRQRLDEALALRDVIDHFEAKGQVITIDATKGIEDVRAETRQKLWLPSGKIVA